MVRTRPCSGPRSSPNRFSLMNAEPQPCNRPFFERKKISSAKLYDPLMAESQYILLPDVRATWWWIKVETTCCGCIQHGILSSTGTSQRK